MTPCAFAIPGDLASPTGGYAYDREVLKRLPGLGVAATYLPLPRSFPSPNAADLAETRERLAVVPPATTLLIDGLAFGAFDSETLEAAKGRVVALVHHPLAEETGLSLERAMQLRTSEQLALGRADAVIVTSAATGDLLVKDFGVDRTRLTVAEPGVATAARAEGSRGGGVAMLAVGAVSPRKGYGVLVKALALLRELRWSLTIVGAEDRAPDEAARLRAAIAWHGLEKRVTLAGALSDAGLADAYASADLFVISSLFEGYGMAATEALAHGLPIVSTTGGALATVVPDTAAFKVPPGDAEALASALRKALAEPALRRAKADAAWALADTLPRWDDTAATVASVVRSAGR